MRITLSFLFLLSLPGFLLAQGEPQGTGKSKKIKQRNSFGLRYETYVPTGLWTYTSDAGTVCKKGNFKVKKNICQREGEWLYFNPNGDVFFKVQYANGMPQSFIILDSGQNDCGRDFVRITQEPDGSYYLSCFLFPSIPGYAQKSANERVPLQAVFDYQRQFVKLRPGLRIETPPIAVYDPTAPTKGEDGKIILPPHYFTDAEIMKRFPSVKKTLIPSAVAISPDNLVMNPGFSTKSQGLKGIGRNEIAPFWGSASETPDLNWVNGNPAGGFRVLGVNYEVLRGQLTQPLEAGTMYCFSMKVRMRKGNHVATNNIGAVFLPEEVSIKTPTAGWSKNPKVISGTPMYLALRDTWMTIAGSITAEGGEKYIYIGQFSDDRMFRAVLIDTMNWWECYYLVDDVSLTLSDSGECLCNSTECLLGDADVVVATPEPEKPGKPVTGTKLVFDNIQFETGSSTLLPLAYSSLDSMVALLNTYPSMRITIEGHTDNVGIPSKNQTLSEDRARTVYDYLLKKGIGARRLKFKGLGDTQPIEDNDTGEGRAKNRRVAFVVGK
jgi:hypothetical protein